LVKIAPAYLLGVGVGGVILLTNTCTLFSALDVSDLARIATYITILVVTVAGLYVAALRARRTAAGALSEVALESANV
jgi:uncharacterized protein